MHRRFFKLMSTLLVFSGSRVNSGTILTGLQVGQPISRGPIAGRSECFSLLQNIQADSTAHKVSYPVGAGESFAGVKRSEPDADQSLPSNAEVKIQDDMHPLPHVPSSLAAEFSKGTLLSYVIYSSESN
jgi:hypothetical protein